MKELRMTEAAFWSLWKETCKERVMWSLTMDDKGHKMCSELHLQCGHICILASDPISNCQLCDGLGKAAGLQMTVCIMFLFHCLTSFNTVSLKDTAWSLQTNEDSKGQHGRAVSSPRTAITAAACRGKCAAALRGSWRKERPPRVWNTPHGTLRNHWETFSGV